MSTGAVRTAAGGALHAQPASKIIRPVNRSTFLKAALLNATGALGSSIRPGDVFAAGTRETLYNGITLADPWPPRRRSLPDIAITPPYLVDPPAVVPIDLGRQLFVDDFLIDTTTLVRTFHRATYHPASPVLTPATAWE